MKTMKAGGSCKKPTTRQSSTSCREARQGFGAGSWKPFTRLRKNSRALRRFQSAVNKPRPAGNGRKPSWEAVLARLSHLKVLDCYSRGEPRALRAVLLA